jgi:hypothetical protein
MVDLLQAAFMGEVNPKLKDPRRRPERQDAREVMEDQMAMSNLPENGFQKIWQRNNPYDNPYTE